MVASPRASAISFPTAQPALYGPIADLLTRAEDEPELYRDVQRQLAEWIRSNSTVLAGVMTGKTNNTSTVTLAASAATTTITDARLGRGTLVILVPTTANASAEVAAGAFFQTYPNATKEKVVLNHANNSQVDRTFAFALIG